MARGRFISRTLGSSRKFADLNRTAGDLREFCQALYPLIVVNADDFGRMAGDAFTVKFAVFPSSPRSEMEFGEALHALHNAGLIRLYPEGDTGTTLQVQAFDPHQTGLHKRTKSRFSEPPENLPEFPGISGKFREIPSELNRTEQNRSTYGRQKPSTAEAARKRKAEPDEDDSPANKAVAAFIKRFCELYRENRHGAKYLVQRKRDVPLVKALLRTYSPERLVLMAHALLVAKDAWIDETDRGIGILSVKASWLESRLAEYEAAKGVTLK